MADITRNTFDLALDYQKVLFQRNKQILDSELNELQDNLRTRASLITRPYGATDHYGQLFEDYVIAKSPTAWQVTEASPNTNQFLILKGEINALGYLLRLTGDITMSAPNLGAGEYTVFLALTESDVNSIADPGIAVSALGETTQRRRVNITIVQGTGAVPPANTGGELWDGGVRRVVLAHIWRDGGNPITLGMIVDRRLQNPWSMMSRERNTRVVFGNGGWAHWSGTDLTVYNLDIIFPDAHKITVAASGNQTVFFAGLGSGDILTFRRKTGAPQSENQFRPGISFVNYLANTGAESATNIKIAHVGMSDFHFPDDNRFIVAHIDGTRCVLCNGVVLYPGDMISGNEPASVGGHDLDLINQPLKALKRWVTPNGKQVTHIDNAGFISGQVSHMNEPWAVGWLGHLIDQGRWAFTSNSVPTNGTTIDIFSWLSTNEYVGRFIEMRLDNYNANGFFARAVEYPDISIEGDNVGWVAEMEFSINLNETMGTNNSIEGSVGMYDQVAGVDPAVNQAIIAIVKTNASANWFFWLGNGAGNPAVPYDLGVTKSANVWTHFKLIMFSDSAYEAFLGAGVEVWVDGVYKTTFSAPLGNPSGGVYPAYTALHRFLHVNSLAGTGVGGIMRVGEFDLRYRRHPPLYY